jgi:hypothetical protein
MARTQISLRQLNSLSLNASQIKVEEADSTNVQEQLDKLKLDINEYKENN